MSVISLWIFNLFLSHTQECCSTYFLVQLLTWWHSSLTGTSFLQRRKLSVLTSCTCTRSSLQPETCRAAPTIRRSVWVNRLLVQKLQHCWLMNSMAHNTHNNLWKFRVGLEGRSLLFSLPHHLLLLLSAALWLCFSVGLPKEGSPSYTLPAPSPRIHPCNLLHKLQHWFYCSSP